MLCRQLPCTFPRQIHAQIFSNFQHCIEIAVPQIRASILLSNCGLLLLALEVGLFFKKNNNKSKALNLIFKFST